MKKSEYLFSKGWVRMRIGVTIWTHSRYPKAQFLFGMAWKMQAKYDAAEETECLDCLSVIKKYEGMQVHYAELGIVIAPLCEVCYKKRIEELNDIRAKYNPVARSEAES